MKLKISILILALIILLTSCDSEVPSDNTYEDFSNYYTFKYTYDFPIELAFTRGDIIEQDKYLLVTLINDRVLIIDKSDPNNLVKIGIADFNGYTHGSTNGGSIIVKNILYNNVVISSDFSSLLYYNLETDEVGSIFDISYITDFIVVDDKLLVIGKIYDTEFKTELYLLDISDEKNVIVEVEKDFYTSGSSSSYSNNIQVYKLGDYIVLHDIIDNRLYQIDIDNISNENMIKKTIDGVEGSVLGDISFNGYLYTDDSTLASPVFTLQDDMLVNIKSYLYYDDNLKNDDYLEAPSYIHKFHDIYICDFTDPLNIEYLFQKGNTFFNDEYAFVFEIDESESTVEYLYDGETIDFNIYKINVYKWN